MLKEYLVYRLYGRLTSAGHRVRLARVTYEDTEGEEDTLTRFAFFIEHEDELAARLGAEISEDPVHPDVMNPDLMRIVDVFQYMIGNTDWSVTGLHNILLLKTENDYYPIPFDFDWTGLVNARYATPDPGLRLRSVEDRYYRGICYTPDDLQFTLEWRPDGCPGCACRPADRAPYCCTQRRSGGGRDAHPPSHRPGSRFGRA